MSYQLDALCHCIGIRKTLEQFGRNLVYSFVSALCAQHHGHQQLEDTAKLQFGAHIARVLPEIVDNIGITFLLSHLFFSTLFAFTFDSFSCIATIKKRQRETVHVAFLLL